MKMKLELRVDAGAKANGSKKSPNDDNGDNAMATMIIAAIREEEDKVPKRGKDNKKKPIYILPVNGPNQHLPSLDE